MNILDYLMNWYWMIFRWRIYTPKDCPRKMTCYIFANRKDMVKYCKKNNIKYDKYLNNDYLLLNENEMINLVGIRITKVHLISSYVPNLVKDICQMAIDAGCGLEFYEEEEKMIKKEIYPIDRGE